MSVNDSDSDNDGDNGYDGNDDDGDDAKALKDNSKHRLAG